MYPYLYFQFINKMLLAVVFLIALVSIVLAQESVSARNLGLVNPARVIEGDVPAEIAASSWAAFTDKNSNIFSRK
jgi:hypothetical protein